MQMSSKLSFNMHQYGSLFAALMLCLSLNEVAANPTGAPASSCSSMTPGHGTLSATSCPFEIIFDKVCRWISIWIILSVLSFFNPFLSLHSE